jgi:hypothetical protein
MDIPVLAQEEERKAAFEAIKQAVIQGADTRIPQDVPPGTTEASYPALEHEMDGLSSRDYFLKVLDRPHYPDKPAKPKPQVRNGAPVIIAQDP